MIGICTDSGSQLPTALVERFAAAGVPIEIVPLTVSVGDVEYLDGIDLCADRLSPSDAALLTVASPSSGQLAGAYDDLVARGCTAVISIHAAGHANGMLSGTTSSARLAARSVDLPVKVIDAGVTAVGVGGCVWAIAEALSRGASIDEAALVAEAVLPTLGCVVMSPTSEGAGDSESVGVGSLQLHTWREGGFRELARVRDHAEAVRELAVRAVASGGHVRLGVGHSDAASGATADELSLAIREAAPWSGTTVLDLVRFRFGPSAGVYAVPGVVACVMLPVP